MGNGSLLELRRGALSLLPWAPLFLLLVTSRPGAAGPVRLAPGEYITENGWGHLTLKRDPSGGLTFAIEAVGSNAHSCSLDGEIVDGRATLAAAEEGKPCRLRFLPEGDGIQVTAAEAGPCAYFCGARARFEGLYLKPAPGCSPPARDKTRSEFKKLYDQKAYAQAFATLKPLLEGCAKTTGPVEKAWIRNDLALTAYKRNDRAGCRRLLEPLAADAARGDAALRGEMAPADADDYLPVVKATRTNLKLCRDRK